MAKLSTEAKKIIGEVRPALIATANRDGRPNVSPRGSFRVLDDEHVIFVEGGRLYTLTNLRENLQLSAIVYNPETRQGCRIWGKAEILESGDLFDTMAAEADSRGIKINYLVMVKVEEELVF